MSNRRMGTARVDRQHVDAHIHFFNARYIPVEGVARIRGGLLGPPLVMLAWFIIHTTPHDPTLDVPRIRTRSRKALQQAGFPPFEFEDERVLKEFITSIPLEMFADPEMEKVVRAAGQRHDGRTTAMVESLLAMDARGHPDVMKRRDVFHDQLAASISPTERAAGIPKDIADGVLGVLQFLGNLRRAERALLAEAIDNQPGVGLFVHLMMDMDDVFKDHSYYDYERSVRRMQKLSAAAAEGIEGRPPVCVLPMVAFSPYRLAKGGSRASMDIVRCALEKHGFLGVKFYPPLGYRPALNDRSELPGSTPEELDSRCQELFEYCSKHDVPIMAHCTPHGMALHDDILGIGRNTGLNADPVYWQPILEKFEGLRLCFAHTGGQLPWNPKGRCFGLSTARPPDPTPTPWAYAVLSLCGKHANVYADLGDYSEVVDTLGTSPNQRLLDSLRWAFCPKGPFGHSRYPIPHKMIYGSDYPMPARRDAWHEYYSKFIELFDGCDDLRNFKNEVFRSNALAFMNLPGYLKRASDSLTATQRQLVQRFIER